MKQSKVVSATRPFNRGFTLVELMVAMVLGLVVVGGALSIVASNKRSYRTNEALSQVQESARTAYELLARNVRQVGLTGCDNTGRVANVLNTGTPAWWQGWLGIRGYDGAATDPAVASNTTTGTRVAGTDSIHISGANGLGFAVKTHQPAAATIELNATSTDIAANDILVVCDFDHAAILQVTAYNSTNRTLTHANGAGSPGNCSTGLGHPTNCGSAAGNVYTYAPNSQVLKFSAVDWFIGNNGRTGEGGRSLFRRQMNAAAEEVVAGVRDLQIQYRVDGANTFVDAASITTAADWDTVNAVSITLVMDSADVNVSTDPTANTGRLQRTFTNIITLRNRVP